MTFRKNQNDNIFFFWQWPSTIAALVFRKCVNYTRQIIFYQKTKRRNITKINLLKLTYLTAVLFSLECISSILPKHSTKENEHDVYLVARDLFIVAVVKPSVWVHVKYNKISSSFINYIHYNLLLFIILGRL